MYKKIIQHLKRLLRRLTKNGNKYDESYSTNLIDLHNFQGREYRELNSDILHRLKIQELIDI